MAKVKGEKPGIKSAYLHAKFGGVIDYGFTSVPKLLIKHADKFPKLQDADYWFIVQILYAQDEVRGRHNGFIKDEDLPVLSCRKTLQRFRKRIQEIKDDNGNQLVKIESVYYQENGKVGGSGTLYNFEAFFNYLVELEHRGDNLSHRENNGKGQNVPSEDKKSLAERIREEKSGFSDKLSHINNRLREFKTFKDDNFDERFEKIYISIVSDEGIILFPPGNVIYIQYKYAEAIRKDLIRLLYDCGLSEEISFALREE